MSKQLLVIVTLLFLMQGPLVAQRSAATFTNPLLQSGADPFSFFKDGYYYYTHSLGNRIGLWKTKNLANLKEAEHKNVYKPPTGTAYSKELWAPEIHYLQGKWYIYFAADDGNNDNHRMYVLENASKDPLKGEWTFKGKVSDPTDKWAIDGDVFMWKKQLYMIWSGWEGDNNGQQNIYIAKMKNPWTIEGNRTMISAPSHDWETHGDLGGNPPHVNVNEGPQALIHNDRLFIVFSASGCWTDFYALGMLQYKGNDPLEAGSWTKYPQPLFKQHAANSVYAPGHNSFFTSPDGKESWILYHANDAPGQGCGGHRSPRAQPFTWKEDGTPELGEPVKTGTPIAAPAQKQH